MLTRHAFGSRFTKLAVLLAIPFCLIKSPVLAAGSAQCETGQTLAAGGENVRLAKGFNLPNWDPFYKGYKPDDTLLKQLHEMGFTHIRLPIFAEKLMKRYTASFEQLSYLAALDETVSRLSATGYAVSVDMHPDQDFQRLHQDNPEAGFEALQEAWDRIVEHSADWPKDLVYFELLNEPVLDQDIWWQQAQRLVTHLNETANGRRIIVGPAVYQRYEPLLGSEPLKGDGIVYAIHFYDPMVFTHQAMTWSPESVLARLSQIPFPADLQTPKLQQRIDEFKKAGDREALEALDETFADPWDPQRIASVFEALGDWSREFNIPVIVNEFGVLNFDVDRTSRINWLRAVRQSAEASCIGWAHWDFSDGFAMVDDRTSLPDAFVMDALLGAQ